MATYFNQLKRHVEDSVSVANERSLETQTEEEEEEQQPQPQPKAQPQLQQRGGSGGAKGGRGVGGCSLERAQSYDVPSSFFCAVLDTSYFSPSFIVLLCFYYDIQFL